MFLLLIKIRLISARNIALDSLRRQTLLTLALAILGVGLFAAVYLAFFVFFRYSQRLGVFDEIIYQVFYFLFLFLLAGAAPFVAATLLQSADYALLFNAPVPPRAVIAAKLLDATVTNSVQFSILGLPAIAACAAALGLSAIGWLALVPLTLLFVLLPALLTALGLLLLLALFGIRRLRAAIAALNAVMALVVCATIVLEAAHLPRPGALHLMLTPAPSPAAHAAPSAWFARVLINFANGSGAGNSALSALAEMFAIALGIGALYGICVLLGAGLLSAANVAEEESATVGAKVRSSRIRRWLFSAPVAALIAKDFKYMRRDSILLSQLGMPMILFCVPFLLAVQDVAFRLRDELLPSASMMIGIILFMQTSILSLSSIGLEGRSFWILLTAPNGAGRILMAKWIMSASLTGGIGVGLTLFSGVIFRASFGYMAFQSALILCCAGALCGMGVGISAALPRFLYENPAHRVSGWALILGFFATMGYLTLTALLAFGAFYAQIDASWMEYKQIIWTLMALTYLSITFISIVLPIAVGARRLAEYEWEA